jgi:hypothetical protein
MALTTMFPSRDRRQVYGAISFRIGPAKLWHYPLRVGTNINSVIDPEDQT